MRARIVKVYGFGVVLLWLAMGIEVAVVGQVCAYKREEDKGVNQLYVAAGLVLAFMEHNLCNCGWEGTWMHGLEIVAAPDKDQGLTALLAIVSLHVACSPR